MVVFADGININAVGIITRFISYNVDEKFKKIRHKDLLFVPELDSILLSTKKNSTWLE